MTEQLRTRLRQAADGHISGIHVPDLVHRAQVSKRRHRYAAAGVGVLTAAVLVGGGLGARAVLATPDAGQQQPANPTGTGKPTSATDTKWQSLGLADGQPVVDENARIIREVLDPDDTHIVGNPAAWDGTLGGSENAEGKSELAVYASFGWRSAGEPGPGDLQVTVATGWAAAVQNCDGDRCRDVDLPGGVRAKTTDGSSYAYERADGTVVEIMSSSDAATIPPLKDYGISEEQIAELLTNEELAVPVKRVSIVAGTSVDDAKRTLLEALGDDAEKYRYESGTDDDGTTLEGKFTGGGTLTVDLDKKTEDQVPSGGCQPGEPAVCEERTVDGQAVTTWSVTDQDPGNFQSVLVEGDQQSVHLIYYLPAGGQGPLTLDELVEIAVDDGWQQ